MNREMYVYKSVAESRVTNVHHIIHSALTGSRSPAGPRRLGTATRISASLFRRLSAFFGSTPDQAPKAAKLAVLIPGPGMLVNVRNAPRVVIPPPSETPPVSPCEPLCAILLRVPAFARESKRGPFVREVENRNKKRFETALWRQLFGDSCGNDFERKAELYRRVFRVAKAVRF